MMFTTSIYIGGIIFHFEEQAGKRYHENKSKIDAYFLNFANGQDILLELDNRIGEILLSMLDVEKQYLTDADVVALFQKLEEYKEILGEEIATVSTEEKEQKTTEEKHPFEKKIYRDSSRKLVAGVMAGIGYYFRIDPVWIRIIFILFLFDVGFIDTLFGFLFDPSLFALTVYGLAWFILPENSQIKWEKDQKRFLKHPNDQIIGGVASGIASYFSLNPLLIRIAFLALLCYDGIGLFFYLLLFIITPEAVTDDEQTQIKQGNRSRHRNFGLFYERINTLLFSLKRQGLYLAKKLKIKAETVQTQYSNARATYNTSSNTLKREPIFLRVFQIVTGLSFLCVSIFTSVGIILICLFILDIIPFSWGLHQLFNHEELYFLLTKLDVSFGEILRDTFSLPVVFAILFVFWWPVFLLGLLGVRFVIGKNIYTKVFWSSVLISWMTTLLLTLGIGGNVLYYFRQDGHFKEKISYLKMNKVRLDIQDVAYNPLTKVHFQIIPTDKKQVEVVYKYGSFGSSRLEAITSAKEIEYAEVSEVTHQMTFDSHFHIKEGNAYRGQSMEVTILMPYLQDFSISNAFAYQFSEVFPLAEVTENKVWEFDYLGQLQEVRKPLFDFSNPIISQSELELLEKEIKDHLNQEKFEIIPLIEEAVRLAEKIDQSTVIKEIKKKGVVLDPFNRINSATNLDLDIIYHEDFSIKIADELSKHLDLKVQRNTLEIRPLPTFYKQDFKGQKIKIYLPTLKEIHSAGFGHILLKGFSENEMTIDVKGAGYLDFDAKVEELSLMMNGSGNIRMKGSSNDFALSLTGNCHLEAEEMKVSNMDATILGNCSVSLDVRNRATIYKSDHGAIKFVKEPPYVEEIRANE